MLQVFGGDRLEHVSDVSCACTIFAFGQCNREKLTQLVKSKAGKYANALNLLLESLPFSY